MAIWCISLNFHHYLCSCAPQHVKNMKFFKWDSITSGSNCCTEHKEADLWLPWSYLDRQQLSIFLSWCDADLVEKYLFSSISHILVWSNPTNEWVQIERVKLMRLELGLCEPKLDTLDSWQWDCQIHHRDIELLVLLNHQWTQTLSRFQYWQNLMPRVCNLNYPI